MPLLDDKDENEEQPNVTGNVFHEVSTKIFTWTFSNFGLTKALESQYYQF